MTIKTGSKRYLAALSLFTAIAVSLCGCYHISRGGSSTASKSLTTVAVPLFKNTTEMMGIEVTATESFIRKLDYYGAKKVESVENARSIIEGVITGYNLNSVADDQRHKVTELRLSLTIEITVRDTSGNEVVFKKDAYTESYDFKVPRDSVTRKREVKRAESLLCDQIASSLLTEIYEGI